MFGQRPGIGVPRAAGGNETKPQDLLLHHDAPVAPLSFSGLWESNEDLAIECCTIIVTPLNALLARIHN